MREFLRLTVTDHSDAEISGFLANATEENRAAIRKAFVELRLYKTNEFAFLDVFDESTFKLNSAIVREVVRLLQHKRLRYTQKQPFMGEFFERLLATSVKQESGQFFTLLPIARFILEALPIESVVEQKLSEDREDFLPYVIDYASGSGHFLTEAMDRIDHVLQTYQTNDARLKRQRQRSNLKGWKDGYAWAKTFIYGLERDYRLAKTAKVSCFLNGDGEANVIRANGLDNFQLSDDYREAGGILPNSNPSRDNGRFDVVVANPPFSVRHFKRTVNNGPQSFELWDKMSETSPEIELLFVERTKQLLRSGGVAGIILPNSVLQTGGIGREARLFLLRHFQMIAVAALGPNTFMKTGIGTVVLFLRRRRDGEFHDLLSSAERIVNRGPMAGDLGLETAYAEDVLTSSATEFRAALSDPNSSDIKIIKNECASFAKSRALQSLERRRDFKSASKKDQQKHKRDALVAFIKAGQLDRIEVFALIRKQAVLAVVPPEDQKQEIEFLGYKFSERRGRAGMMFMSGEELISTPLFDPKDSRNPDKISTLIRQFFDAETKIPASIQMFCKTLLAQDLIEFEQYPFDAAIRTRPRTERQAFKVPSEKMSVICTPTIGGTPPTNKPQFFTGKNLWVSIKDMKGQVTFDTAKKITDTAVNSSNVKLISKGTTLVSFKLSVGRTAKAGADLYTNEAIAALVIKPAWAEKISDDYLFALFTMFGKELINAGDVGGKKLGTVMNKKSFGAIDVPILSKADMRRFVKRFEAVGIKAASELRDMVW